MMTKKDEDEHLADDDPTAEDPTSDFLETLDPLKIIADPPAGGPPPSRSSDDDDDDTSEEDGGS